MRIIFVRQQFTPFGGGELILDRTITAMTARGMRVALLARSWSGRADIEFIRCDPPRFPRIWREPWFARAACERLGHESGSIVQAHERIPCCDVFRAGDGVHAAYLENRARGMTKLARLAQWLDPYHRSVLHLERALFLNQRLQAVLANSAMVADEIVRHYSYPRERIHLVPNGIDLARFRPEARVQHRAKIRAQLGVDKNRPVVLFIGSGFKRKGLAAAIAALALSRIDAELWVIGGDRRSGAYAALASRVGLATTRLRLIGPVTDPLPYYAGADALILPAVYDPFPSTVIEALACGLPVVTSTGCGARDAAARLDSSLVRDQRDVEGLAEALRRALDLAANPATIDQARSIASEYGIDAMIERMLPVYDQLKGFDRTQWQGIR
jgi:UDP-glucose:(heptosyl)LPS alpha-1,3-glucosyltransferase